jgi:hypothetical protein
VKKCFHLPAFLLFVAVAAQAQIADGSKAPEFNCTDLNGNSYNLCQLSDQRKTVFLDISTTWCAPVGTTTTATPKPTDG